MTKFIKCEMCDAEIPEDKCEFATVKQIINGEEYVYCCIKCQQKHQAKMKRGSET